MTVQYLYKNLYSIFIIKSIIYNIYIYYCTGVQQLYINLNLLYMSFCVSGWECLWKTICTKMKILFKNQQLRPYFFVQNACNGLYATEKNRTKTKNIGWETK